MQAVYELKVNWSKSEINKIKRDETRVGDERKKMKVGKEYDDEDKKKREEKSRWPGGRGCSPDAREVRSTKHERLF